MLTRHLKSKQKEVLTKMLTRHLKSKQKEVLTSLINPNTSTDVQNRHIEREAREKPY